MDVTSSDEELDFIKRPPLRIMVTHEEDEDEGRPATPPMDHSTNLSKSLGLVLTPQSPPYRRIRSMKIVESPKSFLKCRFDHPITSTPSHPGTDSLNRSSRTASARAKRSRFNQLNLTDSREQEKLSLSHGNIPVAYLNPFTPEGRNSTDSRTKSRLRRANMKRSSLKSDDSLGTDGNDESDQEFMDFKRPRLSDFNTQRYLEEFIELGVIGSGVHGCVYRCLNRLNGVEYAVKRGLKPLNNEKMLHNEIYAHGVLEHPNIIRNYSNWREDDYVYLQNEYCNGGSLEKVIESGPSDEKTLRKILEHIAQGLRFIHSKQLAHMDIKPENILITKGPRVFYRNSDDLDEYPEEDDSNEETVYKIGDLGHVTRLDELVNVVEGDCRYIPREILNDDYTNLTKVDIFALGLTLYEAAGGGPLPKNGDEWHSIRDGNIKTFDHLSLEFNSLLKRMTHPNPNLRPSASELLSMTTPSPLHKTVKEKQELKVAKQKILLLEQQIQDAMKYFKVVRSHGVDGKRNNNNNKMSCSNNNRMVGKKARRSQSTTSF